MDWFIFFLLKKKARIVKRKLAKVAKRIVDIFYASSDVISETKVSGLEDSLTIGSDVHIPTKEYSFTDELRISDDVINALSSYSFEDSLSIQSDVREAIKCYSFEDSLTISDEFRDVSKRQYNMDKLFVFSDVQQYSLETKPYSFEDVLTLSGDVEQLTEPIKRYEFEDTLTISDDVKEAKAKADVEDSLTISDDVKEAVKRYNLSDEFRISDNVIESVRSYSFEDSLYISDSVTEAIKRYGFEDVLTISDELKIFIAETKEEICDFMNLVTDYEYDCVNVFFVKSRRLDGYYYCVIFVDGRDTYENKHYYIGYTTADEVFTHCDNMIDYDCSSPYACWHDYADESEFCGATCGVYDWVVLLYQASKNVTITPKYIGETIIDACGYERPAWSHFQGFVIHKSDGTKEYKPLEEFTVDRHTIDRIAFTYPP